MKEALPINLVGYKSLFHKILDTFQYHLLIYSTAQSMSHIVLRLA